MKTTRACLRSVLSAAINVAHNITCLMLSWRNVEWPETRKSNRGEKTRQRRGWTPSFRAMSRDAGRCPKCLERGTFQLEIACGISSGRGHADVSELIADGYQIDAGLEQSN